MTRVLCAIAGLALAAGSASAQWSDNFDSYVPGSINTQGTGGPNALGTWQGWDGVASAAGEVVTTQFLSAPHSQRITAGDDSVQRYQNVTSGQWSYRTNLYVPTGNTGDTYFILMNQYTDVVGPYAWSSQIQIDCTSGLIFDDQDNVNGTPSVGSASLAIIRNQWVPMRVDFDLTANTVSSFYNNTLIYSGAWKRGVATASLALAAVDLYHATGTGNVFYDNSSLVAIPAPSSIALLGLGGLLAARRRRA